MTSTLESTPTGSELKLPVPSEMLAAKQFIVDEGTRLCAAACGNRARAVVLTGSMSRGETTLKRDGGGWRVLGDATFLVVFDVSVPFHTSNVERAIEQRLADAGIECKVVVVMMTTDQLRKMHPHIYAYELRERGVALWGDKEILQQLPAFRAADIPTEDGWWLLCNRMIEQLESAARTAAVDDTSTAVQYRIAKLYLAMAACYLLAVGRYEPSYRDRAARLRELSETNEIACPIPLARFSEVVSLCTELKLSGESPAASSQFPRWPDAVLDAQAVWAWVLVQIVGLDSKCGRGELMAALAARQSLLARGKGWLRAGLVRRSELLQYWRRWARLALTASPRYLVYGAASELFFSASAPDAVPSAELAAIAAKLPLTSPDGKQPLCWRDVAGTVAYNFRVLLESNRS